MSLPSRAVRIISIHALLAESDTPRVLRHCTTYLFLSTLSLRRATLQVLPFFAAGRYFYPRSPCGERRAAHFGNGARSHISIHALLAESDCRWTSSKTSRQIFLSTLSLRRATLALPLSLPPVSIFLSTLSLRRATVLALCLCGGVFISIHALLAESDKCCKSSNDSRNNFYPRSPCGERHKKRTKNITCRVFLSTLSLRRATFNAMQIVIIVVFLSTLSLRRATQRIEFYAQS